ncbi:MAG: prepilin-type N-terminal cleavage/methylation domain-containing protein [Nitrospirae bacterium]|nr:prepilin-type N-terminal cleavage/methylation domain-containing protein [Nitrospirota bacterium]
MSRRGGSTLYRGPGGSRLATRDGRSKGFTLMELMVALFTLAVLMSAAIQGYYAVSRGRAVITSAVETDIQNMAVLHQIVKDLQSAYVIQGRDNTLPGPRSEARTFFACEDTGFGVEAWDKLSFTSVGHVIIPRSGPERQYESELTEITYELVSGGDDPETGILQRREVSPPAAGVDDQQASIPVAERVAGFDVACIDSEGRPREDWDSRQLDGRGQLIGLPVLVRITLVVKGEGGEKQTRTTAVTLPLAPRLNLR